MPVRPNAAKRPRPATAGGSTSGSSNAVERIALPRNSWVAIQYATGVPKRTIAPERHGRELERDPEGRPRKSGELRPDAQVALAQDPDQRQQEERRRDDERDGCRYVEGGGPKARS